MDILDRTKCPARLLLSFQNRNASLFFWEMLPKPWFSWKLPSLSHWLFESWTLLFSYLSSSFASHPICTWAPDLTVCFVTDSEIIELVFWMFTVCQELCQIFKRIISFNCENHPVVTTQSLWLFMWGNRCLEMFEIHTASVWWGTLPSKPLLVAPGPPPHS